MSAIFTSKPNHNSVSIFRFLDLIQVAAKPKRHSVFCIGLARTLDICSVQEIVVASSASQPACIISQGKLTKL